MKGRVHSWFEREEAERAAWAVGLERGDVDITLDDNVLTIRAEKKQEAEDRDRNYHVTECAYGVFYRTIELPPGVDPSSVYATLKIMLPDKPNSELEKFVSNWHTTYNPRRGMEA